MVQINSENNDTILLLLFIIDHEGWQYITMVSPPSSLCRSYTYNVQCTLIDRKPPFINYQFHYLEMKKFQNKILAGEMELSTIMKMAEFVIVMMITYYCNEQKNELTWSALPMGTVRWSHPQLLSRDHQKIIGTCLHSL